MEETLRQGRSHHVVDAPGARRLTEDRHVLRIAAESADVLAHPLECSNLVEQTVVARRAVGRLCCQSRVGEEAEHAEAIVDRDHHDALASESRAVVPGRSAAAGSEAATVDPHHDRAPLADPFGARPDVEEKAVLAALDRRPAVEGLRVALWLPAVLGERARVELPDPRLDGLWRSPAQVCDRRLGVGNALERKDALRIRGSDTAHRSVDDRDQISECDLG